MTPGERRAAIVDATLRVMVRRGIAGTTVRDVAGEMGTSSGLIHHYFASMDELLAEAFDRMASDDLARTAAAVASERDPIDRLSVFFDDYNRSGDDWGMQLWLDAWAEASRRPTLQQTSKRLNEEWQALVVTVIGDGVTAGVMSCDDPDASAWRIISLLDGLALQVVAHGDLVAADDASRWARGYAEDELALPRDALRSKAAHET